MAKIGTPAARWIAPILVVGAAPGRAVGNEALLPEVATYSIVAADTVEHEWGVAVASRVLAVGSIVPWARAGVGAVATQASANTAFGPTALALMERRHEAPDALRRLLQSDREPATRQVALVDAQGIVAVHTGERCQRWAGAIPGQGVVVQGNHLPGPEVLDFMMKVFLETHGSLAEKMLAALRAGEEAGGDSRGKQSAALVVVKAGGGYRGGNDRLVDLRVDDHDEPVRELERLYRLHAGFYLPAVHIRIGDELLAGGERAKAEREYARVVHLYRQAIAGFPRDARLPNGLAWFYVQHRVNLDEAHRLAQAAKRIDPSSWEIEDTLAEICFARGNVALAHRHALAALGFDPANAYLKTQAARFEEALEMSERR
jgi:uncharacterized Ntn-hydrolase superfamily protein